MPIYEFGCNNCGCKFEEIVFGNQAAPSCPQCGSEDTTKLISACCRQKKGGSGDDFSMPSGGGGCAGCSGGNCASCGH